MACNVSVHHLSHPSFINFIDRKRDNFFRNGREIWKFDDCATVPHTTDYEGLRGDGDRAPDSYINPGDFTWALHNYYLAPSAMAKTPSSRSTGTWPTAASCALTPCISKALR